MKGAKMSEYRVEDFDSCLEFEEGELMFSTEYNIRQLTKEETKELYLAMKEHYEGALRRRIK